MNTKDNGGPAFARSCSIDIRDGTGLMDGDRFIPEQSGMTLRDYFAASFLQGYISVPGALPTAEHSAKRAYEYADAMLKVRES